MILIHKKQENLEASIMNNLFGQKIIDYGFEIAAHNSFVDTCLDPSSNELYERLYSIIVLYEFQMLL